MADPTNNIPPVLDLDAFLDGRPVRIKGEIYQIKNPGQLSIVQNARFDKMREEWYDLWQKIASGQDVTDDEDRRHSELLRLMAFLVLEAPDEVKAGLGDVQRLEIAYAFWQLPYPGRMGAGAAAVPADASIGENSSQNSSDSTAATPSAG